ncbi:MAG: tyrosine protein kinase, partial [Candidatus Rokubacteria bacterium]|nr:tyrosine protein kinase [Candidatus Rokubacteria bacterium]
GTVPQAVVRRAKEQVEAAHGRILGVVVNRFDARSDGYSRYYYDRYYGKEKPS